MKSNNKISFLHRMTMPLPELEAYYREQRATNFHNGEPLRGIVFRKRIHNLIHMYIAADSFFAKRKLTIIGDRRIRTKRPVIYTYTHIGRYDIEMAMQTIHNPAYIFFGDPGYVYKSFDYVALWLNGVIFLDTGHKEDRYIGKETCVKLLKQGGNVVMCPEGAWNITENQIVMPLYTGAAEMAIRAGAEIVPIAIEQYGKHFYANVGENISPDGYTLEQKQELTDLLRDTLCTLKWDIWTQFPNANRADFPPDAAEQFVDNIMSETENGYTVEEINRTRFHTKDVTQEEAFTHISDLQINHSNIFLFNKRLK